MKTGAPWGALALLAIACGAPVDVLGGDGHVHEGGSEDGGAADSETAVKDASAALPEATPIEEPEVGDGAPEAAPVVDAGSDGSNARDGAPMDEGGPPRGDLEAGVADTGSDTACSFGLKSGPTFTVGTGMIAAPAIADLNQDGKLDLAANDGNEGRVKIYTGNGDGTFQTGGSYAAGEAPFSVAAADLNADGHPDLVVPNFEYGNTASASVLLGLGDGTFDAPGSYGAGVDPEWIAVGDLNGDHHPDLVVSNYLDATIGVLLGKGDGTFGTQTTARVYGAAGPVALGDLNGDGNLDAVVANTSTSDGPSGTVSVLLGNGDGTFRPYVVWRAGFNPTSVAIADLNADRNLDLVVSDAGNYAAQVLLGNGDGTFQAYTQWPAGTLASFVAVADLNGDRALDLAVTNDQDGTLSVLLGLGDGTFAPQIVFDTGPHPDSVTAGDFDGDGLADLAVGLSSDVVEIFLSRNCPP